MRLQMHWELRELFGQGTTGFTVQAKYDLEAQSEVGLRAGLTEEQKKLFSYFCTGKRNE